MSVEQLHGMVLAFLMSLFIEKCMQRHTLEALKVVSGTTFNSTRGDGMKGVVMDDRHMPCTSIKLPSTILQESRSLSPSMMVVVCCRDCKLQ